MNVHDMLKIHAQTVNEYLNRLFDNITDTPDILKQAMVYSISAGGKRIRPTLMLEFYRILGGEPQNIVNFAAALEMIHTYSLIHDDLPCMDDDDMRRGQPSCHIKFGEDIALLAGDALLTQAFNTAADIDEAIPPERALKAIGALSFAAGMCRMVGGQVIDLQSEGKQITLAELERLQYGKTVAMLRVSAEIACILAGADDDTTDACIAYCENVGKAFQIRDDILDVIADEKELGKPIGSDEECGKNTYVTLLGLKKAQALCDEMTDNAVSSIKSRKNSENLAELAILLCSREK